MQEEEALLAEMEFTQQAFEEMQEQNIRLMQQLREKDDSNLKLMSEVIFLFLFKISMTICGLKANKKASMLSLPIIFSKDWISNVFMSVTGGFYPLCTEARGFKDKSQRLKGYLAEKGQKASSPNG